MLLQTLYFMDNPLIVKLFPMKCHHPVCNVMKYFTEKLFSELKKHDGMRYLKKIPDKNIKALKSGEIVQCKL